MWHILVDISARSPCLGSNGPLASLKWVKVDNPRRCFLSSVLNDSRGSFFYPSPIWTLISV